MAFERRSGSGSSLGFGGGRGLFGFFVGVFTVDLPSPSFHAASHSRKPSWRRPVAAVRLRDPVVGSYYSTDDRALLRSAAALAAFEFEGDFLGDLAFQAGEGHVRWSCFTSTHVNAQLFLLLRVAD